MEYVFCALIVGVGATAVMDLWGIVRKALIGVPPPNYGLVGRWLAGVARGRFRNDSIAASPAVHFERLIGWSAHYLIGIAFAAVLLSICGLEWIKKPTIVPALIVGIGTVAAPFLLMQPGMGAGIAASRTPNPAAARLQSLITHAVFGLGLYGAGFVARFINMQGLLTL
jgi:hypothetical protein